MKQQALKYISVVLEDDKVTLSKLSCAPKWFTEEAYKDQKRKWEGNCEVLNHWEIPRNANIIRSHVVYKVKDVEDGSLKSRSITVSEYV